MAGGNSKAALSLTMTKHKKILGRVSGTDFMIAASAQLLPLPCGIGYRCRWSRGGF